MFFWSKCTQTLCLLVINHTAKKACCYTYNTANTRGTDRWRDGQSTRLARLNTFLMPLVSSSVTRSLLCMFNTICWCKQLLEWEVVCVVMCSRCW